MSDLEQAERTFQKADKMLRYGVFGFAAFITIVFTIVVVQLFSVQNTIAKNQAINSAASAQRFQKYTDDNRQEHEKTQKYIRCIAQTLLLPIEDRTNAAFDQCSAPALDQTNQ